MVCIEYFPLYLLAPPKKNQNSNHPSIQQKICKDADNKREDMKWLVKTLDSLLPYASEIESKDEQTKLEALIARYKVLIPTIEITMVKTEVFSKCYTYRREVHEIVCLLDKVKEQTVTAPPPESLDNLRQLIQEQQFAVSQLDNQRAHIMSMLQRGRDLGKDVHAPAFLPNEIKQLEAGWTDTYTNTIDKLRELSGTEAVWNEFQAQKQQIMHLLGNAETALRSITPLQTDPKNVTHDLKAKRELNATLQQASRQMIGKLHGLCDELTPLADPIKKPLIEREVTELEKQFFNTMEHVKDRVHYLEDYNSRWNNYKARVAELQNWSLHAAPQMIEAVQSHELSPEERVSKTEALQAVILEKMRALDMLASDASELAPKEGNAGEAKRLRAEVGKLQEMLSLINRNVNHQTVTVKEDLQNWQKYQAGIQEIKPWIERSESKVNLITEKPTSLMAAVTLQQQAQQFAVQCEEKQGKIHEISSFNSLMSCKTNAPDELDAVQSRWSSVQDNAKQISNKYDRLVANWQLFEDDANRLESWINQSEQALAARPNLANAPQIDVLEMELIKLKSFNNDISEQQAKMVALTQSSEQLTPNLAADGVNHVKNRMQTLRGKISKLSEAVRAKINEISDAIMLRQDFNAKLANFSTNMDRLRGQIAQIEEMYTERVEPSRQIVHMLLQEHAELKPSFNVIYEEVKELTLNSTPDDGRAINDSYTALVLNYQNVEDDLQQKRQALEQWTEFLSWKNDLEANANHIKQQLDKIDKLSPDTLKTLNAEIDTNLQSVVNKKPEAKQIDSRPVVLIKDTPTGKLLNAQQIVHDLENKLHNLQLKAQNQIVALHKIEEKKSRFVEIENRLGRCINETKNQLDGIVASTPSIANIDDLINKLNVIQTTFEQSVPLKEQVHDEGAQLMRDDIASMPAIQESILILNKRWDELHDEINTQIQKYTVINQHLKDYISARKRFEDEFKKAQDLYGSIESEPKGEQQLLQTAAKSKSALDQIRKSKNALDDMEYRGNGLAKLFESIGNPNGQMVKEEMQRAHEKWQKLHEQIAQNAQLFETEAIIWNQIDEIKADLLLWLDETIQSLDNAANNTLEIEYGPIRLNKYRSELPQYEAIRNEIIEKIDELTRINHDAPIPALNDLKTVLNDKFTAAEDCAQNLLEVSSTFEEQEKALRASVKKCGDSINKIRDGLIKCDDMSGDNNQIVQRLKSCQALKAQLDDEQNSLDSVRLQVDELKGLYPTFAESIIPKELSNVQKRMDAISAHANKIEASLTQFLKKYHADKIGMLKRLIGAQKEKIVWCIPEPSSDKYNLEVKKTSMNDVEKGIDDCAARLGDVVNSIGTLNVVDSEENLRSVENDVARLSGELSEVKQKFDATNIALVENLQLWDDYETQSESLGTWLRAIESKLKNEAASHVSLETIDGKGGELQSYDQEIKSRKADVFELEKTAEAIMQKNYETRVGQTAKHMATRYQALGKSIASLLERAAASKGSAAAYAKNKGVCEDWIQNARIYFNELSRMGSPGGTSPTRQQLDLVKAYVANFTSGQAHLNDLVNAAEALYPVIAPDDRERIRNEVRQTRDNFDYIHEEANSLLSQVEALLFQKTSIEESYLQVKKWLDDARAKILAQNELYPNLSEKKLAAQKIKSQLQDNSLHKNALKQLDDKAQSLADIEAMEKVKDALKVHDELNQTLMRQAVASEAHVTNHESYDQVIERAQDWMKGLKLQTVEIFNDNAFDKDGAEEKLKTLQKIIAEKKHGEKIINACKNQLEKVLVETHPAGHPALINGFESIKGDFEAYFAQCEQIQSNLANSYTKWNAAYGTIEALDNWLKQMENVVKDQSMKSTCEAKQAHLAKLQQLNGEIQAKAPEFAILVDQCKDIDGENALNTQVSRLNSRYQTLKNQCKEGIVKYDQYAKNHNAFNADYDEFKRHLQEAIAGLQANSEIVGDLAVLQARQNALRDIADVRAKDATAFEDIIDRGEKLYGNTNPEGREMIRQQLRALRSDWDKFTDDLNGIMQQVEHCLLQFSDFNAGQEQLTKWLKDVEKAMQNHTELKTTLQEKRAQLQNHKLMNEDIISHRALVDTVCQKAQTLVNETKDESLNAYLQSIRQLFKNIVEKSKDLLQNLDGCVQTHQSYNSQLAQFKNWLIGEKQKLEECGDGVDGEKSDIKRKISTATQLKANKEPMGTKLLEDLKEQAEIVKKCTSPKGVEAIDKDIREAIDDFNAHFHQVADNEAKLNAVLQQWDTFDKDLDTLTKWCRATEAIFRDQQLQSTFDEKANQLATFKNHRDEILAKQKAIDAFTDQGHTLLNHTGAEKIKMQTGQLTNRYQLLQMLSKEVLGRWQALLDDHRKYNDKLNEIVAWLEPLEHKVDAAMKSNVEPNQALVGSVLEQLLNESANADALLSALDASVEKTLQETSTQGREKIRNEIRSVNDRWDNLSEEIRKLQKKQEAQSLQLSTYQESLQQSLGWLETHETLVAQEKPDTWTSIQEIRSKQLKYKAVAQDILAHKRIIETLNEKANAVVQNSADNADQIRATIDNINTRYENLNQNCGKLLGELDDALNVFQKFNDLQKYQLDYQKSLWDRLNSYTDYSGNKLALQERLVKIDEIHNALAEGEHKLLELSQHIEQKASAIPYRCKEVMTRDLSSLKVDFDKFKETLQDVKTNLKNRLQQWSDYDINLDYLLNWLNDAENSLKNFAPKNTLDEKQEQCEKFQVLAENLCEKHADFDRMTDESTELIQNSNDSRIVLQAQQVSSRFQSIQNAAKEIAKICAASVMDHQQFNDKYKQCADWLTKSQQSYEKCCTVPASCSRDQLLAQQKAIQEIAGQQSAATLLLNNVIELGEKLYPNTDVMGRETIRLQIQELTQLLEKLFDNVHSTNHELQNKLSKWSGFEDCAENLATWLTGIDIGNDILLKSTLDEKRQQLQVYRDALSDIQLHQSEVLNLKDISENMPEKNENVDSKLSGIVAEYDELQRRVQSFVERYEAIVSDHQLYSKAVMDTQDFIEVTHNTIDLWGDLELERVLLRTNLNRLRNLQANLNEEQVRVEQIRKLGEKVIPGTATVGQPNIQAQIDSSQQEWQGMLATVQTTCEAIESKLQQWDEFEKLKDECINWIRAMDNKLHSIDLKATFDDKKAQLEDLKQLQGEVRAKELEVDNVSEKAQLLHRGATAKYSQITDLIPKYQQISHKVKELTARWQQFVNGHQDLDGQINECTEWLGDINAKLDYCSDLSTATQKELQNRLGTVQDMLLLKDEGFAKVQSIVEMAQNVLLNTAPNGHDAINKRLTQLQNDWSTLALRMVDIRTLLDKSINQYSGFVERVIGINKSIEWLENALKELSVFQTTMPEKRAQLESIKSTEEKVRVEKIETDAMKVEVSEMLTAKQPNQTAFQALQTLERFDALADGIKKLLIDREAQYRDHRLFNEAKNDLSGWINRSREKLPTLKPQTLTDKLSIENSVAPLEALLNKKAQGELLVEHLIHTGEVVMASTSPQGKESIKHDIKTLRDSFESLFKDIQNQRNKLEATMIQWRDFKEEFDRLSEWLQQIDILVKNHKIALMPTLSEKQNQVADMRGVLQRLEKGQSDIDKFNAATAPLLTSHLDTYVNSQLSTLNSRYQVQLNLAKDVLKKVETNHNTHKEYEANLEKSKKWIEKAWAIIRACSEASDSKDLLQQRLRQIQDLLARREDGQVLVHATVNTGEKVIRSTRSDGRDDISNQIKDLQSDWDRLVKKMSTAKVHLETSLLQWADYNSSYSHLQQWITDREAKLQQACEPKVIKAKKGHLSSGLNERRANLRQTNNIVQDIVSFEPMIQSVTSKASDLMQGAPATEISTKYQTLTKQAKDLYEKQKEEVAQHQALIDAENEFASWLRNAKERFSKCSEPTGDKETLSGKLNQLTVLESEIAEGKRLLDKTFEQGEIACGNSESDDKEILEETMAFLQDEFDNYV